MIKTVDRPNRDESAFETIILPGYSSHNRDWAEEIRNFFGKRGLRTRVYEWRHWRNAGKMDLNCEAQNVIKFIGDSRINVIAKSIGTRVFALIFANIYTQIRKVVLCGIPAKDRLYLYSLNKMDNNRLMIIQNSLDPLLSYHDLVYFLKRNGVNLEIVKKDSSTHQYPYYQDFLSFLTR